MNTQNLPVITDEHCLKEFGWSKSRFEIIQRTYFKGLSYDEIAVFGHVCKHVNLDPFIKQIYPVIREVKQKDGTKKPVMTIQTGIDGYRAIAERTGKYSPGKEPLFKYDKDGRLFSATSYVMKMTADGKWHEIAATAIFTEYCPSYPSDFWNTKKHIMLSKCAEALALRKAFPAELSGVYTKEEMDQADIPEKLSEAECEIKDVISDMKEEDTRSLPILKEENKHDLQTIHTNLDQDIKVTADQVRQILEGLYHTDTTFKTNLEKYRKETWGAQEVEDIPQAHFSNIMGWIKKNIRFNEEKKNAGN